MLFWVKLIVSENSTCCAGGCILVVSPGVVPALLEIFLHEIPFINSIKTKAATAVVIPELRKIIRVDFNILFYNLQLNINLIFNRCNTT